MYRNILVPIAFDDDQKVDAAMDVARTLVTKDGQVTLLHVMEHVPAYAVQYVPEDLGEAAREGIMAELQRLAGSLPGGQGVLTEGHAGRTILEYINENDIDCVVIASHRPGMADYLLGSTAAQVVRHAPCAVMVTR